MTPETLADNILKAPTVTHQMSLAGARSLRDTIMDTNQIARAEAVYRAMVGAQPFADLVEALKEIRDAPILPYANDRDIEGLKVIATNALKKAGIE